MPIMTAIPLFEYGEGTGAIGCVSITSPVFLSEEEAFAIIYAAFAEAGLDLRQGGETLNGVNLPITDALDQGDPNGRYSTTQGSMIPDGMLDAYGLPVAFVSTRDVADWYDNTGMGASVSSYNTRKTARTLAENNPYLAVFYDPVSSVDYNKVWELEQEAGESDEDFQARWEAMEQEISQESQTESARLLRLQVDAFIEWLATACR